MLLLVLSACYDALVLQVVLDVIWPSIVFKLLALCTSSDVLQVRCPSGGNAGTFKPWGANRCRCNILAGSS